MRTRIKTQQVEKVDLSHLKAFKLEGRNRRQIYKRFLLRRTFEIADMFRAISVHSELIDKAEANNNCLFYV